ncbi:MAG: glycogen-binding domain-containing protein, partial [Bacteroidota bacterium]
NQNSVLNIGSPTKFYLDGYTSAQQVVLSGTFNDWSPHEIPMTKTTTGWEINYVLPSGNYEYKFVVDGKWITDPNNSLTTGSGDYVNSFVSVNPNWTFELDHLPHMKHVEVSGNFNGWSLEGYPLQRKGDQWVGEIYLPTGKCLYKFLVNDEWMVDPKNDLYENNEFGTRNSIVWISIQ